MSDNETIYNIPGGMLVNDILDVNKIENAFKKLIELHSSFRTCFKFIDDKPVQVILDNVNFNIEVNNSKEANLKDIINNFPKSFNLENAPLLRVAVHFLDNKKTLILIDSHHIIVDGSSLNILINDFCKLYNNLQLEKSNLEYIDYAVWENDFINSNSIIDSQNYWVNNFKNSEIPVINLPYDYTISATPSYSGDKISMKISNSIFENIETLAKKYNCSSYMVFLATFYVLLYKYTSQDNIIVGSPIANRFSPDLQNIIGMFVNNIALNGHIESKNTFSEFLDSIKTTVLEAMKNQAYPYDLLVKKLELGTNNLFDVMFTYQNTAKDKTKIGNNEFEIIEANTHTSKFNLSLEVVPSSCVINLEFRTDLFKKETVTRMLNHYINLLNNVSGYMSTKISDISMLSNDERNMILYDFNNTKMDYPIDKTIAQLFEEQVERTPDKVAVVFEGQSLTYRELNEKANMLAWYLRKNKIGRNDIVSIMTNRSLELIVSILGTLKSGACYIPIDPNFPKDRIDYMLENSNSKLLLTNSSLYKHIDFKNKLIVDLSNYTFEESTNNLPNINSANDTSYIIYTSGSTGKPKGVVLKHCSLTNLAYYLNNYVCFLNNNSYTTIASVTTASFDIFIFETLIALQKGLKVVLANEDEQRLPDKLNTLIANNDIKAIQMTPSRMKMFLDNITDCPSLSNLDYVVLAGEPLPDTLLKSLLNLGIKKVYNGYGPSETTVFSTFTDVTNYTHVNIGKPLSNTQTYILDKDLCPVPVGIPGELYIAGDGVGKGYLNNQTLTNERFINNIFDNNNSLMYKTGDICKFLDNGEICYLERIDNQVKIRGLRIELEEIENKLLEIPIIKKVKVIKQTFKDRDFISAYYVATTDINVNEIRKFLSTSLPNYMIPSYFTALKDFPYTPNGKIDKNALPFPNVSLDDNEIAYVAPKTNVEITLVNILEKILNVSPIGLKDNFFNLGGDSLTAIVLCSNIKKSFNVDLSFKDVVSNPIVEDLANTILNANSLENLTIKNYGQRDFYPISSAQKRIYLSSNIDTNSTLYNISGGILLETLPDINKFQKAVNLIVSRHDALKSYFEVIDGEIVQKIDKNLSTKVNIESVNTNDTNELFKKYQKCFNLNKAPLWNINLLKLPNNKCFIILNAHHIILDGTSLNNLIQEISDAYNQNTLPKLPISYTDFAIWEEEQLQNNGFSNSKEFWQEQFKNDIPILNMPTTFSRPANKSYDGNTFITFVSKDITKKISNFASNHNVTPYMVMLCAYYILLYKYTSQEDIVVGSPISGRLQKELEPLLGMFVNSLPLKATISSNLIFTEFLNNVKNLCMDAFSHQDYPFDVLVNDLNIPRDNSRNPLFDTMFIYQNNGFKSLDFDGINATYCVPNSKTSKFDISLEVLPVQNELKLSFEYCTKLFDEYFINKFSSHYLNILNKILENSDIKISDICMISTAEKEQIINDFNNTKMDYPSDKTIADLFEEQVERTPNNIAVVFGEEKLTYKELDEKSTKLSDMLYSKGIRVGDTVGVCLNRSIELIVSLCAIFKLGAVYMPMYINYPKDRLIYMLENSNSKLLIANSNMKKLLNYNSIILDSINDINCTIENNFTKQHITPNDIAYIIYTSGSTGKPKGVQISNMNLINFVYSFKKYYNDLNDKDTFLSSTNISFDVSIFELFLPLLCGSKLVLYKEEIINDLSLYCDTIVNNQITALYIPPNILNEVHSILENKTIHINKMLVGVEAIKKSTLNKYLKLIPNLKILNGYGPTEATICCTAFPYQYDNSNDAVVSIGKPLFNNQIFILSSDMNIQPIGVLGEIYIAGDGVGHGYINDTEKTNKSYLPNIYSNSSAKMYKTGDLAKWNPDGTIDFIGRNDSQIKISGHRIELKEINYNINLFPHIDKVFSTTYKLGHTVSIVSYFTADKHISVKDLTAFLKQKLADYMVPNFIVQIDSFPLTTNGKIDKEKLPKNFVKTSDSYVAPRNKFEKSVVEIWHKLLGIDKIGIDDNFFDLGGDSLIAIKFQFEAMNIGLNITYADIFTYPTIKQLSEKSSITSNNLYSNTEYDYSKIDKLIAKNCIENVCPNTFNNNSSIGNILLIGSTGFLGAHILDNYLSNHLGVVYCLIRVKDSMSPEERLKKILNFYFGNKYNDFFGTRIIVINGDIIDNQFCLSKEDYCLLGKSVNVVINSAAIVKHYGDYKLFNNTNVIGTSNIIKFCETFNIKFYHISTLSVSGSGIYDSNPNNVVKFSENDFYINQNLNNVYIYTKFEAEKIIFEEILSGKLSACILRIGNITNRFSDGKFQINVTENAFASKIKSILKLSVVQKKYLEHSLEFTPVDFCSDAIIKIVASNPDFSVFHLFNSNLLRIDTLLNYLNSLNINIKPVDDSNFSKIVKHILSDDKLKPTISGIITDLDKDGLLNSITSVLPNANFTEYYLKKLNFVWPKIDINYIRKYIEYFNNINFID